MDLLFFLIILGTFYAFSVFIENEHMKELARREKYFSERIRINNMKTLPIEMKVKEAFLCSGNVVMGANYYRRFAARLKQVIGGHLKGLENILQRGYREARLRMMENAYKKGATIIINVRYETTCIGRTDRRGNRNGSMIEVFAYGTAICPEK